MFSVAEQVRKKTFQSAGAVTFYMTVSLALVFLNRLILTDKSDKAGALFVSWYQFVVAYVLIILITTFFPNVPLLNLFPPLHYKWDVVIKVIPVSVTYLLVIGFNNKCLEYVSVSAYQIVRALTIVFNIMLTWLVLGERTSFRTILACIGVVIGFCFGVEGEIGMSFRGAVYGVLSSVAMAAYSIVVKRALGLLDRNEYVLIEYNTPIAIIALAPFVWFAGEFSVLSTAPSARFWALQTLAGTVGFLINIAIFLNINYTSALTHNLSGTVKGALQTLLAFVFFPASETMTVMKFIGTVLVISCSAIYAYIRKQEMTKRLTAENEEKEAQNREAALLVPGAVGFATTEVGEHESSEEEQNKS
jgi:GDP-fucose transporter C1